MRRNPLRQWFGSGYASGGLIERLRHDFSELECESMAPDRAEFRSACGGVRFSVGERVESHWMLQIATAEFVCRCPRDADGDGGCTDDGVVTVRHRGSLRRTGIEYRAAGTPTAATRALETTLRNAAELTAALLPLDFTQCRVHLGPSGIELRMRHYAACEIVGQLPRFRRYVRLGRAQRESLIGGFRAFRHLIAGPRP